MQNCKFTKRIRHQFDPVTHQCPCGRYERGFTPKRVINAKPRAICQICEGSQAVNKNGEIGNHGYKRPGYGSIEGSCIGVGYLPYPETDAMERYATMLRNAIQNLELRIERLRTAESLGYSWKPIFGPDRGKTKSRVIMPGFAGGFETPDNVRLPSFKELQASRIQDAERTIEADKRELSRILKRIEKAMKEKQTAVVE